MLVVGQESDDPAHSVTFSAGGPADMRSVREQVGDQVRRHRERSNLTQAELAARTERSVQMIGRIERGGAAPSFETLEALASALDVPIRDFFGSEVVAVGTARAEPMDRLVRRLSGLDDTDLAWVEDLIETALTRRPKRRKALRA